MPLLSAMGDEDAVPNFPYLLHLSPVRVPQKGIQMNKLHPLKVIAFSLIGSALIYTAMEFRHERISNYSSGVALEKISSKDYDFAVISAYVDGCHLPKLLCETFDTGYNVYEEEQIEDDGTVVFFVYTVLNYSFHPVYDANISSPGELGNILCNPNPQGGS